MAVANNPHAPLPPPSRVQSEPEYPKMDSDNDSHLFITIDELFAFLDAEPPIEDSYTAAALGDAVVQIKNEPNSYAAAPGDAVVKIKNEPDSYAAAPGDAVVKTKNEPIPYASASAAAGDAVVHIKNEPDSSRLGCDRGEKSRTANSAPDSKDHIQLVDDDELSPQNSTAGSSIDHRPSILRGNTGKAPDVKREAGIRGADSATGTSSTPSTEPAPRPAARSFNPDSYVAPTWIAAATASLVQISLKPDLTLETALDGLDQPLMEASPPEGHLAVPLMKHQRIALYWMIQKETCCGDICTGGILADDQGLGKTLSTIALIVSERPPNPMSSGSQEEILEILSSDDDRGEIDLNSKYAENRRTSSAPTTTMSSTSKPVWAMNVGRRPDGGTLVVCPTSVLRQWADEIQNKVANKANLSYLVYHGSNRTRDPAELAKYDVVLTTYAIVGMEVPKKLLEDSEGDVSDDKDWLDDYYHLFAGAGSSTGSKKRKKPSSSANSDAAPASSKAPEPFAWSLAMVSWFRVVLDEAQTIKNHQTLAARACSRLRAKRRWCLSGTPIQNSITDLYSYFRFLRYKPYTKYHSFFTHVKHPTEYSPAAGYANLQAVLRKVLLRRTKETLIDGQPIVRLPPKSLQMKGLEFSEEERSFYDDLESMSQERFKEFQDAGTLKQNYVSILVMLLRLRQACDHPALLPLTDSSSASPTASPIPLPDEAAAKLGKDKCLDLLNCLGDSQAICAVCSDPPEDALVSVCGHVFCSQCVSGRLAADADVEGKLCPKPNCTKKISSATVFTKASLQTCIGDVQVSESSSAGVPSTVNPPNHNAGVLHADSSKIKAAMEVLLSLPIRDGSPGASQPTTEKALVFSQWTKMLDLLEKRLRTTGIVYRRLDGTMSVTDRDRAVKDFNSKPEVTVMLMSLKAASLGLNMIASNHVLLLDPWWNPTTEDQAIDRAHRIGQTRPVNVTRFTVKDTVEDRILKLQEKKRKIVASAFGEVHKGSRQTRLSEDDLSYLFKM